MNTDPIDALARRGAITTDQQRSALKWAKDRELAGGLPKTAPPSPNLLSVRAEPEMREDEKAKNRYNELHTTLSRRCGVLGRTLAYELIIERRKNEIIENMFFRMDHGLDVTERQRLIWAHMKLAFEEIERAYAFHETKKKQAVA